MLTLTRQRQLGSSLRIEPMRSKPRSNVAIT
jgi:hypothetical protein